MRKLEQRKDVALLLLDWIRPLKEHYSEGGAQLKIGATSAHYGESSIRMEGFSRVLWGLGPLFSQSNSELPENARQEIEDWKKLCRSGLIHGTDPQHEEYWLDVWDFDQKMVEMAAIANAILLAPDVFWEPLTPEQQKNVYTWFNQINLHKVHANNWRFFRIIVNMLFDRLGLSVDDERVREDFDVIEGCYEGDGWYYDGHPGQKDYYIPFAMHYYGLLYARQMREKRPEYCEELLDRAARFYADFIHWFDEDGREVPFGRSLTYRFAHSAVFSAMAFAGVNVPLGELKHLLLGNLRYWCGQPIFDCGGILTIGYQYPNLIMSERYNAPGSPYWGFKTFLILALPEEHPFWRVAEQRPDRASGKLLKHPNMIAVHEAGGHTLLYPTGQFSANFGNTEAKYQKFVYSNQFGFSVSRGTGLEDGAFDNTLAASAPDENHWRMRSGIEKFEVTEKYTRTLYTLMPGVRVESLILPQRKGHVRIHYISAEQAVLLADGGFAIPMEQGMSRMKPEMLSPEEHAYACRFPWGSAGAVNLDGQGCARLVTPFPNTNLMYGITVIPTIRYELQAGTYCLINYFYGSEMPDDEPEIPEINVPEGKKWL